MIADTSDKDTEGIIWDLVDILSSLLGERRLERKLQTTPDREIASASDHGESECRQATNSAQNSSKEDSIGDASTDDTRRSKRRKKATKSRLATLDSSSPSTASGDSRVEESSADVALKLFVKDGLASKLVNIMNSLLSLCISHSSIKVWSTSRIS